jgi:hypothetical protein
LWTAAQPDPAKAEQEFAAADPEFASLKNKYDRSRSTVTRTGKVSHLPTLGYQNSFIA